MTPPKTPFTNNFLVRYAEQKELLEGFTTVRLPRKLVTPLKRQGINVGATIEKFLASLLDELETAKKGGDGK